MNPSCNQTQEKINGALDELEMNIQRRHSFLAPDEMRPDEGSNTRGDDYRSTSSDCTSAGLPTGPMSTSESSGEQTSSYQTDPVMTSGTTFAYQMPQIQQRGTPLYQPATYNQQHQFQQGYTFPCAQMGVSSFAYAPVQVQSMPMGVPLQHQFQPNQVFYPVQQCQPTPQDCVPMPLSSPAVPSIMVPVSYSQQINPEFYQASPSVASSTASTPILSCYSTPGYSTPYGYVSTPVMSSASCTPIQCPAPCQDVPPVLNLNHSLQAGTMPQGISCSINMGPVPQGFPKVSGTPPTAYETSHSPPEKLVPRNEEEDLWPGTCNYVEYQRDGGSNLFITWSGSLAKLVEKLHSFKLDVRDICSTSDENVCNVIFESHPIARKAFTMQHQIRLRIVPPKSSHRIWLRNPSPKFLVKFETKCKLVVRKGKAECHDIVGELLKGSLISADQLKGHRIRVVCCEGSFMFPGGKIVEMKGVPNKSEEKASLGWISYRSKYTKESLVIRRSWNMLSDYIYRE